MTFRDLADDERLRARFDTSLVYSLGELWTAALVRAYGEAAIGNVLRALASEGASRATDPRDAWRESLRRAGYDLETVDAAFERMIADIAEQDRAAIDALPRIGGGVAGRDALTVRIVMVLDREPGPGWTTMVRIRRGPDAGDTEVLAMRGTPTHDPRRVEVRVPRVVLPAERFELLFSVTTREHGWPLAETWQWASAP